MCGVNRVCFSRSLSRCASTSGSASQDRIFRFRAVLIACIACIACNARRQRIFHKAGRKCIAKRRRMCVFIDCSCMTKRVKNKRPMRSFEAREDVDAMLERAKRRQSPHAPERGLFCCPAVLTLPAVENLTTAILASPPPRGAPPQTPPRLSALPAWATAGPRMLALAVLEPVAPRTCP